MKLPVCAIAVLCLTEIALGQTIHKVSADQPDSLYAAVEKAQPGDVIRLAGGVYKLVPTVKLTTRASREKPIRIEPLDENRPVLDFSGQAFGSTNRGIEISGEWWHLAGLEIRRAGDNGVNITGHHNVIERCVVYECGDTGIQIHRPASHNLVVDCDSFRNVDIPNNGESADGFAAKFEVGPGNVFRRCRAWENADDGWDLWKAPQPVRIEDCLAFRNGINLWGIQRYTGDGNGFKLGGDHIAGAHVVINCVAVDQPHRGFDQNNNTAALTIENSTAIRCAAGFYLPKAPTEGRHVLKRNISIDSTDRIAEGTIQQEHRNLSTTRPATATP